MKRSSSWVLVGAAVCLLATACGEAGPGSSGSGKGDLSGSIAIDGSSTVFPIAQAVAEDFQIANPDVKVSVGFAGTGGGFEAFCAGETDISNASRPIEAEEAACLEKAGIEFVEFQVGVDGLAVATNKATDWVDCLTFEQLQKLYAPGSKVTSWNQLDPSWPDQPIRIFGPDPDSGTYDYFAEEVADPDADEPATRDDMTQSADDNVLVQGVRGEEGSIGYFGYAYFAENASELKALQVDPGDGTCVSPSPETVQDNSYPLSRPLFFYVTADGAQRPEVASFVRFWVDGAPDFATAVGYMPAPSGITADNQDALEDLGA